MHRVRTVSAARPAFDVGECPSVVSGCQATPLIRFAYSEFRLRIQGFPRDLQEW
jgi:hypothetical protein